MGSVAQWEEAFKQLPAEKQGAVKAWIATQMFIARELGLEAERWFEYVEWAFKHPFDFDFASAGASAVEGDHDALTTTASKETQQRAASLVGSDRKTKLPGSGGKGNLLGVIVEGKKGRS